MRIQSLPFPVTARDADVRAHCQCRERHLSRRIVLTGGPGAGKTAVLELLRRSLCEHVVIVPEAAGVLFAGGFPRSEQPDARRAAQIAIYHVQVQLEASFLAGGAGIMLCDRGAVDGFAYWPRGTGFWTAMGTSRNDMLGRYDAVIHLRVPDADGGYGHQNRLRIEAAAEARTLDERILEAWEGHPRRFVIDNTPDFLAKAKRTLEVLRGELPGCCRDHATTTITQLSEGSHV